MVMRFGRREFRSRYLPFAGEQHGFRQAKNIKRALDGELYFYSRVLDLNLQNR